MMRTLFEIWSPIAEYAVFICALVSLISTFIWSVLNVERKRMLGYSVCSLSAFVILFLPLYLFWIFLSFFMFGVGIQWLGLLMLLITAIFVVRNITGKQVVAVFAYALNLAFLLLGLENLKSSGGTNGNFGLDAGVYIVFNALLILQVLTYLYESNFLYGLLKLFLAIIAAITIIVWGFNTNGEYWGDREFLARESGVVVIGVLIIEGSLLIYKAKKDRYLKKLTMA